MNANRRVLLKITLILGLTYFLSCNGGVSEKYLIDNPYQNIDWGKVDYIPSTSHIHIEDQQTLDRAVYEWGYRHLPVTSYYPSVPYYPISEIRENQFRVKQDFGVMRFPEDGEPYYVEGPIEWNKIIMDKETGWYDSLPEERKKELPFEVGDYIFKNIPEDVIFSPNAEHFSFTNINNIDICALGSLYSSGTFDKRNYFMSYQGGGDYSLGVGLTWQDAFNKIFDQLLYEDGGGITINHPTFTNKGKMNLPQSLIEEMLDFDPRVLGIEVFNADEIDWDLELWDDVLRTGRRCFGFFVPDWKIKNNKFDGGFNILLVDEFAEHNCLKAYREGAFFGSLYGGQDLHFTNISLEKKQLVVEVNSKSNITFITDKSVVKVPDSFSAKFKIPFSANNIPDVKYIRIEVENENEQIFSQPIRFVVR